VKAWAEITKSKNQFSKSAVNCRFLAHHWLRLIAFSFGIFIDGFNGHLDSKLANWEIANMIFEQKREETKSVVYSNTPKTLHFPGNNAAWSLCRNQKALEFNPLFMNY